jgi:3-hydroxyisobutyryl-CoA hydrolase
MSCKANRSLPLRCQELTPSSYHGLATHYIHSTSLPSLSHRLSELQFKDYLTADQRHTLIASTIAEFDTGLPSPRPHITGTQRLLIDAVFSANSPLQILSGLQDIINSRDQPAEIKTWAEKTIKTMRERSPTSVAVTLRQMREARDWNIAETFQKELDIATHFMHHPDFIEGVTARLIERSKERPNWSPNQLEDVTESQVAKFFQNIRGEKLGLLESGTHATFGEYPHARLALPSEKEILAVYEGGARMKEEVVQHFIKDRDGKVGVREKVEEVLERH